MVDSFINSRFFDWVMARAERFNVRLWTRGASGATYLLAQRHIENK